MCDKIHITSADIAEMEKGYRRNFINTLHGYKSANLIGTIDKEGNHNLAIFNSVIHIGAKPPYIGFIMRPAFVPRNTYENIMETGYYTINSIQKGMEPQAHQSSAKYDKGVSEFDEIGLTAEFGTVHTAPYVKESVVKIGLQFKEELHIKLNDTKLIIGEVVEVMVPSDMVLKDGTLQLHKADTLAVLGLETYAEVNPIKRFEYARPDEETEGLAF